MSSDAMELTTTDIWLVLSCMKRRVYSKGIKRAGPRV